MKKLVWNVFVEDINARKITTVNALDYNWPVLAEIYEAYAVTKEDNDFKYFSKAVKSALMHEYWARSEYETVITSWPPYIDEKELDRLNKEREDRKAKGYTFYCEDVDLTMGIKVDIYEQIMLNWEIFINYLWTNRKLIRYFYKDYKALYNRRRPRKHEWLIKEDF